MLTDLNGLLAVARQLYGVGDIPKPFALLEAVNRVESGEDASAIAKGIRSTRKKVLEVATAPDPISTVFDANLTTTGSEEALTKARRGIGQMLLGTLAERSFEATYRGVVQTDELRLEDDRSGRTDTDYRVFNGQDRPVFRINIKFHGSPFRKASDLVGLRPDDCFPLATYKIHSAIKKQEEEILSYLFVVVSIPGLTGVSAGASVPEDLAHLASLYMASKLPRKRDFEDLIVRHLVDSPHQEPITTAVDAIKDEIERASWRIISARRAYQLLHERLFERVYAVRVRGFASNYGRAEVDMHFSISNDLNSLTGMLEILRDHGLQGLTARIERGEL